MALCAFGAAGLGCGRPEDRAAKKRLFSQADETANRPAFDWSKPERVLDEGADELATRFGSFEWTGNSTWSVHSAKNAAPPVHMNERYSIRQSGPDAFEVHTSLDPGTGKGEETGSDVVYLDHMTYARGRFAPWRERPTDRGRDARVSRDQAFGALARVAALVGPRLKVEPEGEVTYLGRPAQRLVLSLAAPGAAPASAASHDAQRGPRYAGKGADEDTQRHFLFVQGATAERVDGEIVADKESGVPLKARLKVVFGLKGAPDVRTDLEITHQVRTLGSGVAAVVAPKEPLPDERKARGVARALEAAGLKGSKDAGAAEPSVDETE